MRRYLQIIALCAALLSGLNGFGQIPPGYYDSAIGKDSVFLQQALHDIIDNHTVASYSALHTHYQQTDVKPNGKVWDMYSDVPGGTPPYEFTFITDKCGNYSAEGDCYNREHSFPQSWFSSASPMKSDLFHVYPTDGYVNGKRSNYPFGEVGSATWTSQNGSKVGPNTYPGSSGTCFEPIDEYKGDFARTYFYMAVRYYTEDNGWQNNGMVNGSQLKPWALDMLYQWHITDTVSQKEIDRNNAVYAVQNNRNPFIDRPDWVDSLWFPVHEPDTNGGTFIHQPDVQVTRAYPNPSTGDFHIFLDKRVAGLSVAVYQSNGVQVYQSESKAALNHLHLDTSGLKKGFYLVFVYSPEGIQISQQKLIVL